VKTLIPAASVARRRDGLPRAKYGARKGTFGIPAKLGLDEPAA
jgi:hypothetical protein